METERERQPSLKLCTLLDLRLAQRYSWRVLLPSGI
jgi:hypothetical protein